MRRVNKYDKKNVIDCFHQEYRLKEKKLLKIQKQKEKSFNVHIEFEKKYLIHENKRNNFFYFLGLVDEKNLLDEEIEIKKKVVDMLQFFEDRKKFFEVKDKELSKILMNNYFMYPFVERHPVLREAWKKNFKKISRYDVDYNDTMHIKNMENKSIDRFEQKINQPHIKNKVEKYNQIIFKKKGLVHNLEDFDVNSKNEAAIEKTKLFGEILNQISDENDQKLHELNPEKMEDDLLYEDEKENNEPKKFSNYPQKKDFVIPNIFEREIQHLPIPGKIYFEELSRMFYLNNNDPEIYNIAFFSEYFDIEPKTLRKFVKTITIPFEDKRLGKIVKVLRFIDM